MQLNKCVARMHILAWLLAISRYRYIFPFSFRSVHFPFHKYQVFGLKIVFFLGRAACVSPFGVSGVGRSKSFPDEGHLPLL